MKRTPAFRQAVIVGLCTVAAISVLSVGAEFSVPYGDPIDLDRIDGVLGPEWDDANAHPCRMGKYGAEVHLKHDERLFYVALVIRTSNEIRGGLEGWVFIDDGDGRDYERGDDLLSVVANDGRREKADHYFKGTFDFVLDTRLGGTNDAYGAGRYDAALGAYVFEFCRELRSGDSKDVAIEDEGALDIEYGWSSG